MRRAAPIRLTRTRGGVGPGRGYATLYPIISIKEPVHVVKRLRPKLEKLQCTASAPLWTFAGAQRHRVELVPSHACSNRGCLGPKFKFAQSNTWATYGQHHSYRPPPSGAWEAHWEHPVAQHCAVIHKHSHIVIADSMKYSAFTTLLSVK